MSNAITTVFDNKDLRKLILTHVVREKYHNELSHGIAQLFQECLVEKWYHYCSCELCKTNREYHLATYGELL